MLLPRYLLLAFSLILAVAAGSAAAQAQDTQDDRWTLKPLLPPVFPVPPTTQVNPATVGTPQSPGTTAPLQNPANTQPQSAPGIRLSIPTR